MKSVILFVFIVLFALSDAFWSDCPGSNVPGPDAIYSPNCSGERCRVERGGMLYAEIHATFRGSHNELRTRVTAFIFGVGINLPVDPPFDDVCNLIEFSDGTRTSCPTIPNVRYIIPLEMPISPAYPTFSNTRVQVDFFDGTERAACGQVIADIV